MNILNLFAAMPGAIAQGLIWGITSIGIYITFRILDIADLSVDGSLCTGGAVCIMMMLSGQNVFISLLVATLAGMAAGLATGIFHTFMGIPAILAGILTQLGKETDEIGKDIRNLSDIAQRNEDTVKGTISFSDEVLNTVNSVTEMSTEVSTSANDMADVVSHFHM